MRAHVHTCTTTCTQFVGSYEQNMMTTARLGSAYHGVVANFTMNGLYPILRTAALMRQHTRTRTLMHTLMHTLSHVHMAIIRFYNRVRQLRLCH
jgi:hypothetical protein